MLSSGLLLLLGNLAIGLIMVGRNVLIANFVSVEHYGIAMTFAITVSLIEMATNLMADTYVVKAENGDEDRTTRLLHSVTILRGVLNAVLLFLAGPYIAQIFQVPNLAWAYQTMAIIPLIRGFTHIDIFRVQRHGKFRPKVLVEIGAFVSSLIAAWICVVLWGDFRAMLATLIVQWSVFTLLSHIVADRKYKIGWDNTVFSDFFIFGWPLMLNAMLAYAIQNGDRVIVGNQLGPEVLGWFSAAFMLAQTPSMLLMSARRTLFMPMISRTGPEQGKAHRVAIEVAYFMGLAFAVGTTIAGPLLLTALYGERYVQAVPVMLWLGLIFGIRIARGGLTTAAIAQGETKKVLIASLVRVLALPIAYFLLESGGTLWDLLALICVAELVGMAVSYFLVQSLAQGTLLGMMVFSGVLLLTYLVTQTTAPVLWSTLRFDPYSWALLLGLAAAIVAMPDLRRWFKHEILQTRQKNL